LWNPNLLMAFVAVLGGDPCRQNQLAADEKDILLRRHSSSKCSLKLSLARRHLSRRGIPQQHPAVASQKEHSRKLYFSESGVALPLAAARTLSYDRPVRSTFSPGPDGSGRGWQVIHNLVSRNGQLLPVEQARLSPGQEGLINGWGLFTTIRFPWAAVRLRPPLAPPAARCPAHSHPLRFRPGPDLRRRSRTDSPEPGARERRPHLYRREPHRHVA